MMLRKAPWSTEQWDRTGQFRLDGYSDSPIFADFQGTSGDDDIKGSEGDDTIEGFGGDDFLKGLGGKDVIHGGDGNDVIYGGDGDDTLYGEGGSNDVRGGEGDDHIIAGSGYDTIYGGVGLNVIDSTNRSSVYSIVGGVDHIGSTGGWYVDYSLSADAVAITNNGLNFSNGSSANHVKYFNYLLGSGNDSYVSTQVVDQGSKVDAGAGYDYFELINTSRSYLPMNLLRDANGHATLYLYKSNGHKVDSSFVNFENLHIVARANAGGVRIDGSLLYDGIHVDIDVDARYYIDFRTYNDQVTTTWANGTLTINGSTIKGADFNITLNDQDANVTAGGTIAGGAGNDTLTGLSGQDSINGNNGDDVINGADGNDYLGGGNGDDTISGGAGVDQITDTVGSNTIFGGDGNDTITTGDGDDTFDGGADNDTIVTGNGHNIVEGGEGDDTITGGTDNDELSGSAGVDTIIGGLGHNTLNGGDGDDILTSTRGAIDVVDGGEGTDRWGGGDYGSQGLIVSWDGGLHVSDGFDVINTEQVGFALSTGDDLVRISAKAIGSLALYGLAGTDTIDYSTLKGGGITLSLASSSSQDTGAGGLQTIVDFENVIGTAKADTLTGTAAANQLTGGKGADTLTGGTGADTFIFTALADLGKTSNIDKIDRITDFSHTEGDKIDLRAIDADPKNDGDQAFKFVGTDAFSVGGNGPGEIRYSQSIDGYLLVQADINHDGKADFSMLVHNTALVASDFLL